MVAQQRLTVWLLIFMLALVPFLSPQELLAIPYYGGKRITIVVGFIPGMGYDRMARLVAKHLPKYIPGHPIIIIENLPGAGSMIAANRIYNSEKPDGLTIGAINRNLPLAQLAKVEGAKFDMTKFAWIGSTAVEPTILCIRSDLPYKTFSDLRKAKGPIYIASGGSVTRGAQFALLVKEFLKVNLNIISYPLGDGMLAVERKEVDGAVGSYSSFQPKIEIDLVRPLLRGRASEHGIENVPVDEELAIDKTGKTLMAMCSATDLIGRPFVAPPGTPNELMNILRHAFAGVSKDTELIKESKKNMMPVQYLSAEESLKVTNFVLHQKEDVIKEFNKYMKY